jgi:hypothetical protein
VYANDLHARFKFHLTSIYTEEEVLFESGKVDWSILQLSFRNNEGQHWLLSLGRYRAFGLNTPLMAASINLVLQLSDMSSVQLPLFHFVKLESLDNQINLSSTSYEGELLNVSLPTPAADTLVSDSKCSEFSKFVFIFYFFQLLLAPMPP